MEYKKRIDWRAATRRVALASTSMGSRKPRASSPPSSAADVSYAGTTAPRRILIIEDNQDAAEGLLTLLRLFGHTVEVAHDGASGIERAGIYRPEVVLCDIGLPGLTGYDVAAAIRASEDLGSTYLVALTGFGQPGDQERTREAGFNRHLTKPVDLAALRRLLEELPAGR